MTTRHPFDPSPRRSGAVRWALALVALNAGALDAQTAPEQFRKGRAAFDSGKVDAAVKAFETAAALDQRNAQYHLWLGRAMGVVAQNANVVRQAVLARRIKQEFETTVQLDAGSVDAREGLVQFYLRAPGVMGGSVAKAREQAAAIALISPLRGHFARANVAIHEKDPATVEHEFRAAVHEFPDSLIGITTLANFFATTNRADDAFAALDAFLERRPGHLVALFWLGRIAGTTGRQLERGEAALRTVLAAPALGNDPTLPAPANVHFRLGDIAVKRGTKDQARKEFERALELNPRLEAARRALKELN